MFAKFGSLNVLSQKNEKSGCQTSVRQTIDGLTPMELTMIIDLS